MKETSEIRDWLAARLPAEKPAGPLRPTEKPGTPDTGTTKTTNVLDEKHRAVLRQILHRPTCPLADFRGIAAKAGLMPWACMKTLNEWALDNYADLLLEGDPIVTVNQNLTQQIQS